MLSLNSSQLRPLQAHPSEADVRAFHEQGFLAFRDALDSDEVQAAKDGLRELVRRSLAPEEDFEWLAGDPKRQRNYQGALAQSRRSKLSIHFEAGVDPRTLDVDEADQTMRKCSNFEMELPAFQRIALEHRRILPVIEAILGPGFHFYGSQSLSKPAKIGGMKPWHQDVAFFTVGNWDGICGVWLALDEATVENGCMHVLPGGHRLGPLRHIQAKRDCEIDDRLLDLSRALPIPLPPGGVLFFHGMLPHFTPGNLSEGRRRALQFHYRGRDTALIPKEEYFKQFRAANGEFASCLNPDTAP